MPDWGAIERSLVETAGNRVYTDLLEDELDVAVPGHGVPRVVAELATVASANATLAAYHTHRRAELAAD